MTRWTRGDTTVGWHAGGIVVGCVSGAVLIDAPEGVARALDDSVLARIEVVCLSSGVLRDLAGLLPLLEARSRLTSRPATVVFPLGEERPSALLDAWDRGWSDVARVVQDAVLPGSSMGVAGMDIAAVAVGRGEPRWGDPPRIEATTGVGWRVRTPDALIAVGRGPVPDGAVERLVRGADLAALEVGIVPWPAQERRWRLRPDEAMRVSGAEEVWILGDDAAFGVGPDQ